MKPTDVWNTYDGWKLLGYQVSSGEKAKKVEKWTGEKLFHISQTYLKTHSSHDYWAQELDW